MSQVQIRQVPIATSTDAQRVVGSWFPTGYYGNFRARSRADLCNYFRQLARPAPPRKFVDRQKTEATNHAFSIHDNRFKFECDPLVRGTQTGFGKRKAKANARGEFDPLFVSWIPKNTDRKAFVDEVKITSYADDYNRDSTSPHILSEVQLIQPIHTASDDATTSSTPEITAYSMAYKHGQPDNEQSKQIRRETFERFLTTRTRLLEQQRSLHSTSVASCLVWNHVSEDKKPSASNDKMIHIVAPITLQSRVIPNIYNNHNNASPRQRAQSAGPRLISTGPDQQPPQRMFQTQPIQSVKTTMTTLERPHTATTTSREHYTGGNFGLRAAPPPRAATAFERTSTNSMDSLVSKYM
ncbi:unnamed protein product [Rotaria magnacalcarata]|uniref:Domain of unknown function with conserved HDNR motif domain-containing protein n=1 Tax=Rotaria magnacalcarata TaxID=392030 RepID=A0A814RI10_9BILA|nr:unnamed protein product [Rotaria magnacalcarata]CAF1493514.1 unnamed protein product [Rotaria magnacalcarata]CAF2047668.1 unnamed protein product [Rotaria magnacalcarata]CAF3934812.1 unnamed protein product [Rotaria magnacalcarata]CAF4065737.1 unnamed protein product [Rotaria magnacalcarata]